ncbi:MAG: BMP family ABC transporter substrate-binding protein [Clostridia bacterium]|nr:BMP family ABC transporter substrate-binding protein [Clostridia bacterium]
MKKLLVVLLAVGMLFSFAACGGEEAVEPTTFELALVTDVGTIDDKSFNQGTWEGLKQYAEENSITYKYYQPTEQTDAAYLDGINLAIAGGAKVVVCPGYLFGPAVTEAAKANPDISFIVIDTAPTEECANVYSISYAEEQSGYLAGYAAVKDGFTKLGFMGGMAVPAVVAFGGGFVQGAHDAAAELNIPVEVRYTYTGGFIASPEVQTQAGSWYNDGTEVIFACGGGIWASVAAAAEATDTMMIGVDTDQNSYSEKMLTSAYKQLGVSVYKVLEKYYAGEFPGGAVDVWSAVEEGIGLPMETSRFASFSQADYDAIYAKLVDGSVVVERTTAEMKMTKYADNNISVKVIE